jgi:hypothetical protein
MESKLNMNIHSVVICREKDRLAWQRLQVHFSAFHCKCDDGSTMFLQNVNKGSTKPHATTSRKIDLHSCCNQILKSRINVGEKQTNKLHGLSLRANYTDRAAAACRRSDCQLSADRGCHMVSVTDPYGRILGFLDRSRYFSIK